MSANAVDQGATGAAAGVLSGTYPNPGFAASQPQTALAGQTVPGNLTVGGNLTLTNPSLGGLTMPGALDITLAGDGIKVAEGANAKQGTFPLSGAATTTVANTSVTATSRIFLQTQALGTVTVASTLAVSSRSAGVSFTVTPSQATDTSTVAYEIFEPG